MKNLTTLLLALLFTTSVFAQDDEDERKEKREKRRYGTFHSMNFDIGINNILENGKSPQENNAQYAVKPFGSWNFAINSVNDTHIASALHLQWGVV